MATHAQIRSALTKLGTGVMHGNKITIADDVSRLIGEPVPIDKKALHG